jgi:hypothetical protein
MLALNPTQDIGYLNWGFPWFSVVLPGKYQDGHFLPTPFSSSSANLPFDSLWSRYWQHHEVKSLLRLLIVILQYLDTGHKAEHSCTSGAEVRNAWSLTSTPQYVLTPCYLINREQGKLYLDRTFGPYLLPSPWIVGSWNWTQCEVACSLLSWTLKTAVDASLVSRGDRRKGGSKRVRGREIGVTMVTKR